MFNQPFHLSKNALAEGQKLSLSLSSEQRYLIDNWHDEDWGQEFASEPETSSGGVMVSEPLTESRARGFTRSLEELASEVPLFDVASDVRDFGLMVATASEFDLGVPAIRLGPDGPTVPILPADRNHLLYKQPTSRDEGSDLFHDLMNFGDKRAEVTTQPIEVARKSFFGGLASFLAARIAGVRWAKQTGRDFSGGGGGGGGGSSGSHPSEFQKWKVTTQGDGLALFYSGSHACRSGASYLNAPTTPVDVYLPMGTLYLAADAGPGGDYVWDNKMITVPSHTPNYITKRF